MTRLQIIIHNHLANVASILLGHPTLAFWLSQWSGVSKNVTMGLSTKFQIVLC